MHHQSEKLSVFQKQVKDIRGRTIELGKIGNMFMAGSHVFLKKQTQLH